MDSIKWFHFVSVIGLDYALKPENSTDIKVPKFNNKVFQSDIFDSDTNIEIPVELLETRHSGKLLYKV